jgi:hypothetical protein
MTYLATFALAMAALVVDRLWVMPRGAAATQSSDSTRAAAEWVVPPSPMSDVPPATRTLAQRLDSLCAQYDAPGAVARDAFRSPAGWAGPANPVPRPRDPPGVALPFTQRHHLTAIVIHDRTRCAFVDGSLVACGQALDGLELVTVDEESATFRGNGTQAVLRLPDAP